MTHQITNKITAKTGDRILTYKKSYKLHTSEDLYGKEPKISQKSLDSLIKRGIIKKVEFEGLRLIYSYYYIFI